MKIYSTGDKHDSIYHYTLGLLGIPETDTTTLSTNEFFRLANSKLQEIGFILWKNSSDWEFDDSNYTDFPIATCDLVDGQQDYSMPSTALSIERAEVMNSDGDYKHLIQIDKSTTKASSHLEKYDTDGFPEEYDIVGNSILLFPSPDASEVTTSSGLRLYFSREMDDFAITDTATEPGIPTMFHPAVAYGVANEFGIGKGISEQRQRNIQYGVKKYDKMLDNFISRRNKDRKVRIRPKTRSKI